MAKRRPKPDVLHPAYTKPAEALRRIVDRLDAQEWDADTIEDVARICRLAGFEIRDVNEPHDPHCTCPECIQSHAKNLDGDDRPCCPTCTDLLVDRMNLGKPTYCDTCDREVSDDEL